MSKTKQQKLIELLEQKGSVDLLDLQKGTHDIRTSNPASMIYELRKKGYDITTYENATKEGKYISTVYKLNSLPLPEYISEHDKGTIQEIDKSIKEHKDNIVNLKECKDRILNKYKQ